MRVAGGLPSLQALASGTWFPLGHGAIQDAAQLLPSYWLFKASHIASNGAAWTTTGWTVVAAWTAALTILARVAYLRDTERI